MASASSETWRPAVRSRPIENGSDGWLRIGAIKHGSTDIARAKLQVMHIPTADALAADLVEGAAREGAGPVGERARGARGEDRELAADAGRGEAARRVERRERPVGDAEEMRDEDGEAGVGDGAAEGGDLGGDAGHLGHHHDGGPGAAAMDGARGAAVLEQNVS
jgi:hypothetical protein